MRTLYRPDLANLSICRTRVKKFADNEWAMRSNISNIQENVENSTKNKTIQRKRRKFFFITKSILNNNNKFIYKK